MSKKPKLGRDPLAERSGIDSLIRDTRKDPGTKPARNTIAKYKGSPKLQEVSSVKRGLQEGWTRATFIVREEHLEKLKALAYWDRRDVKVVLDEALEKLLKGKHIKPIPEEKDNA